MALTYLAHAPGAARAQGGGRQSNNSPFLRLLAPFILIPLGTIYCQAHEILFQEERGSIGESFLWAVATLIPWVAATLLFEWRVHPGEHRSGLLRRAALFGIAAYLLSCAAAILLGSGVGYAFYTRLPLFAAGLLAAALYPIPSAEHERGDPAADGDGLPLAPTDIVYASAAGNYVELHSGERTIIWRQTMQNAERILGPAGFVRVHRSYIVPWRSIERVARDRKGPVAVALQNGAQLPVSNRYAANLRTHAA